MGNWLQKILPPPARPENRNVPSPIWQNRPISRGPAGLPNASIIYGMAAAILIVFAFFLAFVNHKWFGGLIVLLPAAGLLGFAVHFLKYPR